MKQRQHDLENQIQQSYQLLNEYEVLLGLERDPREIRRIEHNIEFDD